MVGLVNTDGFGMSTIARVGGRADESLSVSLSSGTVTIRNNGATTAAISCYMGVNGGGQ